MNTLLLHNATLIDGTGADPRPRTSVLVEDGIIQRVASMESIGRPSEGRVIDLSGMTLMPGLTDAHVHFGAVGVNSLTDSSSDDNLTTYVISVIENIELALQEGFTTVRDAGGLDAAFARATGVKALVPFHHDPSHSDEILDALWEKPNADPDLPFALLQAREGASFQL